MKELAALVEGAEKADRSRMAESAVCWSLTDRNVVRAASKELYSHFLGQKEGVYRLFRAMASIQAGMNLVCIQLKLKSLVHS